MVHLDEALDVQAALSGLVRAQSRQHRLVPVPELTDKIDGQVLAAGREACQRRVALMAAGIPVVVGAETDDAGSPHRRRVTSDLLHHGAQPTRVLALPLIRHTGQKLLHPTSVRRIAGPFLVAMPSCSHSPHGTARAALDHGRLAPRGRFSRPSMAVWPTPAPGSGISTSVNCARPGTIWTGKGCGPGRSWPRCGRRRHAPSWSWAAGPGTTLPAWPARATRSRRSTCRLKPSRGH